MFCNIILGGAVEGLSFPIGECKVPEGIDGPGQYRTFCPRSYSEADE